MEPELREEKASLKEGDLVCKKCREERSVVCLRVRDTYCRSCFLTAVHHKVRASLGKHKATRPGEVVVVACSGGQASTALVHVLQQGVEADIKRLLFLPRVVFVDEGAVLGEGEEVRRERVREVTASLARYGFPVYTALLEGYNSSTVVLSSGAEVPVIDRQLASDLQANLTSLRDHTAREEFLLQARRQVLVRAAQVLGASKVVTGDSASLLAVELMAGVAGGAGGALASRVNFRDSRSSGVEVLRPLREVSAKEAALYCRLQGLELVVQGRELGTGQESLHSIRRLTQEFLVGLQQNFPATIPTVLRTGDKLCPPAGQQEEQDSCLLCQARLDTSLQGCCALQATQFSKLVSARGRDKGLGERVATILEEQEVGSKGCKEQEDKSECCGQGDGSCQSGGQEGGLSLEQVQQELCYSCRRVVEKVKEVQELPASLVKGVGERRRREGMRKEISEFLL